MNKPRRRAYKLSEWEEKREIFAQLYSDGLTLARVREIMSEEYNFYPTEASCKKKIKDWNLKKNIDTETALGILQIEARRNEHAGKNTEFKVRKRPLGEKKITSLRKRHTRDFSRMAGTLTANTPPDVEYSTPSPPKEPQGGTDLHTIDPSRSNKNEDPARTPIDRETHNNAPSPLKNTPPSLDRVAETELQGRGQDEEPQDALPFASVLPPECIKFATSSDCGSVVSLTGACWASTSGKSVIGDWIKNDVVMSGMSIFNDTPIFSTSYLMGAGALAQCCGTNFYTPFEMSAHYIDFQVGNYEFESVGPEHPHGVGISPYFLL